MALLSQIPAPCDFLGLPPILRVTIPSPSAGLPADEPTLNMTYLESIASDIEQRDVLLRIVSNVIRVTEPHMPDAIELRDPPSPSLKPRRKSATGSVRTLTSRPPEQVVRRTSLDHALLNIDGLYNRHDTIYVPDKRRQSPQQIQRSLSHMVR